MLHCLNKVVAYVALVNGWKTAGYKETGDDYTLEDFEEEELLDD